MCFEELNNLCVLKRNDGDIVLGEGPLQYL